MLILQEGRSGIPFNKLARKFYFNWREFSKKARNFLSGYFVLLSWHILLLKQRRRVVKKKEFLVEIYQNHLKKKNYLVIGLNTSLHYSFIVVCSKL